MNVFSALAALHHALLTGGTPTSISDPQLSCKPIDGLSIQGTRTRLRDLATSRILSPFTGVTPL